MRVIHTSSWYPPESLGGTEVYLMDLISGLNARSIENIVLAGRDGSESKTYQHNGALVVRYPVEPATSKAQLQLTLPHGGFDEFCRKLEAYSADVYHQHAWSYGCGLPHLRAAKTLGMPTVLTLHTPNIICLRGTMMLNGESACDGHLENMRCGSCWAIARGVPEWASGAVARLPNEVGSIAKTLLPNSRITTLLSTSNLVNAHHQRFSQAFNLADRIVTLSEWQYASLITNGIPKEKLELNRQGVSSDFCATKSSPSTDSAGPLRVGFFGRLDELKGIHILVNAIRQIPSSSKISLVIHGLTADSSEGISYAQSIKELAQGDDRISFAEVAPRNAMAQVLTRYDLIAIPSQWLETGPLVTLEAHAAGVPVIGSKLGGLLERVQHEVDGLLVPADDVCAWTNALQRLSDDRELLNDLRRGINPVRRMDKVAEEMAELYSEIVKRERIQEPLPQLSGSDAQNIL